jgi:hypothetical protein
VADPTPAPQSIPLKCGTCLRDVTLSYAPGPRMTPTMYFCPYCHKANRLEVQGEIRGVAKAHDERF